MTTFRVAVTKKDGSKFNFRGNIDSLPVRLRERLLSWLRVMTKRKEVVR